MSDQFSFVPIRETPAIKFALTVVDLKSTNKPTPDRARRRLPPTGRGGPSLKGQTHQSEPVLSREL